MGCVVLYVINGPCGLHTYQENKKVRMGSEYGKLCGGSGRFGRFAGIKVGDGTCIRLWHAVWCGD